MENQTRYYEIHKQLRISIKQTLPKLIKLKKEDDKASFNTLLLNVVSHIRLYIIKRIATAIQKNHFPKNKYEPNDFIDQLFIETYNHIEKFSNEDEFYVWLYKKTNEILDDAIVEEEFDDLFFENIDEYSKKEWNEMEESFTAQLDGDLILKEELSDISYYHKPLTIQEVFIENSESELMNKIDDLLHQEQVDRHLQFVIHNLPLQTQKAFELFTQQQLTLEEIAEVLKINTTNVKKHLDSARKLLKVSLLNRYAIDEL